MVSHANFESLQVYPRDHQLEPNVTKLELSDVDQFITGNHTTPCIVYPFNGNKQELVNDLQQGLENVLTLIPAVHGHLLNEGGRLWIQCGNDKPLQLGVHHLDEDLSIPTYEMLAAKGFPADFFANNAHRLTPPGANLAGFRRDDGCPVAVFQVNFIESGVILTLAFHHIGGDAKTIDHTLKLWADSTRAAMRHEPMPSFQPLLNRAYFNTTAKLSDEETALRKRHIRGYSFQPIKAEPNSGDSTTEPPNPPPMEIMMYHFTNASCGKLKNICKPAAGSEPDFVSSYDVICALTWRCMTRARVPYLRLDLTTAKTEYAHPVDSRGRVKTVPDEYFGNGFYMVPTAPILIADLIGDKGLPSAAQLIRQATNSFNERSIPDLVNVRSAVQGKEEMRWIWHPENVVGTSWTGMRAMREYDFGFGLPASIRLPVPPFEGTLGVLPGSRLKDGSAGFDVYVVLESGCQARLKTDAEFAKFCSPLGG